MKYLALLLAAVLTIAACGSDPDSSASEEGDASGEVHTGNEADSPGIIGREGGQPGIPGSDVPANVWQDEPGTCYGYEAYVVGVHGNATGGDDVVVFSGSDREACAGSRAQALFTTRDDGAPETFFGIVGDLLLLEKVVGAEHILRVVDLGAGTVVLETPYEEPVEIREGGLFYGESAAEFESQEGLNAVGVDCPESGAWFDDSLAVGVSIRSRFDLASHQTAPTDDVTCIPLL